MANRAALTTILSKKKWKKALDTSFANVERVIGDNVLEFSQWIFFFQVIHRSTVFSLDKIIVFFIGQMRLIKMRECMPGCFLWSKKPYILIMCFSLHCYYFKSTRLKTIYTIAKLYTNTECKPVHSIRSIWFDTEPIQVKILLVIDTDVLYNSICEWLQCGQNITIMWHKKDMWIERQSKGRESWKKATRPHIIISFALQRRSTECDVGMN